MEEKHKTKGARPHHSHPIHITKHAREFHIDIQESGEY